MKPRARLLSGSLVLYLVLSFVLAAPRLPSIISDGMILQRALEVPIWGWADPNEKIAVEFAGQIVTGTADEEGRWKLILPPLTASASGQMTIRGKETIVLRDVLVGEVWLCSGQSNMEFPLGSTATADLDLPESDYPEIRLFTVPRSCSLEPLSDTNGEWVRCSPETAKDFSAVAYYFGRQLHNAEKVPVGLIDCSWGGTQAEEWTSLEELRDVQEFSPILQRWDKTSPNLKELFLRPKRVELAFDDFVLLPAAPGEAPMVLADFEDNQLRTHLGGVWTDEWVDPQGGYSLEVQRPGRLDSRGAALVRGEIEVSHWPMIRVDLATEGRPVDLSRFNGIRFSFRGKGLFRIQMLQSSIRDWDNYSTGVFEGTPEWSESTIHFDELTQAGWGKAQPFRPSELTGMILEPKLTRETFARPPAGLFNGMILPLAPFAIRGAIWYQGEGNAGRAYQYRQLLTTLIKNWRSLWGQRDFHFLVVQLPNYKPRKAEPSESAWAELREAQLMALALPQTGLAVSIDVGEADDVHPKNKKEIGFRLASWAFGTVYGRDLVYSGPLYEDVRFEGSKAIVSFKHTGGGLVARGSQDLKGFAVAGADRQFHWASALIKGEEIEVWSNEVRHPASVRYAWADNPNCNLYNKEGFPAAPFRSDDWPGLTVNAR